MRTLPIKQYPVTIDWSKCSKCRICESICDCISFDEINDIMIVNEISCKGCGICSASCPSNAISHLHDDGIFYGGETELPWECDSCSHLFLENEEEIIFCYRRFDMGKALREISDGRRVVIKPCLFSDENGKKVPPRVEKFQKLLSLFTLQHKLTVK